MGQLERKPGGPDNWIEALPKSMRVAFERSWIYRAAVHMAAPRGTMTVGRAIAVAVNAAKKGCATGDLNWGGPQQVNPKSRAEMCAAVTLWEAMKATSHAKSTNLTQVREAIDAIDLSVSYLAHRDGKPHLPKGSVKAYLDLAEAR